MGFSSEWLKFAPQPRELTDGDEWNIFLSYRSVNRTWVLNLYDVLRGLGHKVFFDQGILKAGDELTNRLERALETSQAGILIWTNATRDSDWVRREYETMESLATDKMGFQFVPIKLDQSRLPKFAANRVFLDFSSYPDGPNGGELLRLLYAVVGQPMGQAAIQFAAQQDQEAQDTIAKIAAAIKNKRPARLEQLFDQGGLSWMTSAALGCKAVEGLITLGHNDRALQMLEKLEQQFPRALRPKQLHALALARQGGDSNLEEAQEIMGMLYQQGERDPETVGIYARTWMDRYNISGDIDDLKQSRDLYAEAFGKAPDDFYTGINAAAKSLLLETEADVKRALAYAEKVQQIIGTPNPDDKYWMIAALGESFLIQKNYREAARLYEAAVASARAEKGSHESTWKQARLLMDKLRPSPEECALVRNAFHHLPDNEQHKMLG
jgi:tetratricopeptide (TPR) repeat protein